VVFLCRRPRLIESPSNWITPVVETGRVVHPDRAAGPGVGWAGCVAFQRWFGVMPSMPWWRLLLWSCR